MKKLLETAQNQLRDAYATEQRACALDAAMKKCGASFGATAMRSSDHGIEMLAEARICDGHDFGAAINVSPARVHIRAIGLAGVQVDITSMDLGTIIDSINQLCKMVETYYAKRQ